MTLSDHYRHLAASKLDISEHLGLLRGLASAHEVRMIVELGFRTGVSTAALLCAGKEVVTVDPDKACAPHVKKLRSMLSDPSKLDWWQKSSLEVYIPPCDLLFIDSLHTYKHLSAELARHHDKVRKWIAIHDTETFATKGKDGTTPGLEAAIHEFLMARSEWRLTLHLPINNGLTLLERSTMQSATDTTTHPS